MNSYESNVFIFSFQELYPSKNHLFLIFTSLILQIFHFFLLIYVSMDFYRFKKLFYLNSKTEAKIG